MHVLASTGLLLVFRIRCLLCFLSLHPRCLDVSPRLSPSEPALGPLAPSSRSGLSVSFATPSLLEIDVNYTIVFLSPSPCHPPHDPSGRGFALGAIYDPVLTFHARVGT